MYAVARLKWFYSLGRRVASLFFKKGLWNGKHFVDLPRGKKGCPAEMARVFCAIIQRMDQQNTIAVSRNAQSRNTSL
jgi:hypothetical protein